MGRRQFEITEPEWTKIKRLASEVVDKLADVDLTDGGATEKINRIREPLTKEWKRLGEKYGFDGSTVAPEEEHARFFWADVVEPPAEQPPTPARPA